VDTKLLAILAGIGTVLGGVLWSRRGKAAGMTREEERATAAAERERIARDTTSRITGNEEMVAYGYQSTVARIAQANAMAKEYGKVCGVNEEPAVFFNDRSLNTKLREIAKWVRIYNQAQRGEYFSALPNVTVDTLLAQLAKIDAALIAHDYVVECVGAGG